MFILGELVKEKEEEFEDTKPVIGGTL